MKNIKFALILMVAALLTACGGSGNNQGDVSSQEEYVPRSLNLVNSQVQLFSLFKFLKQEFDANGIVCGSPIAMSEQSEGTFYGVDGSDALLSYQLVTDVEYLNNCTLRGVVMIEDIESSSVKATVFFDGNLIQYSQRDSSAGYEVQGHTTLDELKLNYEHLFY